MPVSVKPMVHGEKRGTYAEDIVVLGVLGHADGCGKYNYGEDVGSCIDAV
jgi:hypothetical protein